jgi:peptidoglycan-N-acetylglucosamine deacetylase
VYGWGGKRRRKDAVGHKFFITRSTGYMATYWIKTPQWLKKLFPKGIIWDMPDDDAPAVYLTFDDGPNPTATPYVLDQLDKYNASATFFCVGNNVSRYPDIYAQVIDRGHSTGNHTHDHLNGWKTNSARYLKNIEKAKTHINSSLFRPPYGRIKFSQVRKMRRAGSNWQICMWDILSGDFDRGLTPQQCLDNVLAHIKPGAIIVFHDSEKAFERMSFALPGVLEHCRQQGWEMRAIPK